MVDFLTGHQLTKQNVGRWDLEKGQLILSWKMNPLKISEMPIDYSKYPPNWKEEIVPGILERAGNCCERCGLQNGQKVWSVALNIRKTVRGRSGYMEQRIWIRNRQDAERISSLSVKPIKPVKVVLTIAHLDHDETNWNVEWDRLQAMCQICHLRYDAREKFERSNGMK